jgi:hypothetical protein
VCVKCSRCGAQLFCFQQFEYAVAFLFSSVNNATPFWVVVVLAVHADFVAGFAGLLWFVDACRAVAVNAQVFDYLDVVLRFIHCFPLFG